MVNWNADNQAKLFVAYMKCHEVKSVNLAGMAEFMGEGCTPKAVSHQIAALKKKAANGTTSAAKTTSTPKKTQTNGLETPRSTSKVTKSIPKTSSNKKRARNGRGKGDNDDNEEPEASDEEDDEEVLGLKIKNYDNLESDHDSGGRVVDRTPVRRSASAAPGRFAGMDDSEEHESDEDEALVLPAKRVKMEYADEV